MATNRVFTPEFRLSAVKRIRNGEKVGTLSQELSIGRNVLYRWCDSYRHEGLAGIERGTGRPARGRNRLVSSPPKTRSADVERAKIAELEQRLGRLVLENDFLKRAFKRIKATHSKSNVSGDTRCTEK